eukprot:RCo045767
MGCQCSSEPHPEQGDQLNSAAGSLDAANALNPSSQAVVVPCEQASPVGVTGASHPSCPAGAVSGPPEVQSGAACSSPEGASTASNPPSAQIRIRKKAPDDARLLRYVDVGTAMIFSKAMAYAKDSEVRSADEEFAAMSLEWASADLLPHWEYVTRPVPESPDARKWHDEVRDSGHEGWRLEDFMARPQARAAGLAKVHVAALRLYTGPGYTYINGALRELNGAFPVTVRMCMTAITMLATAAAEATEPPPPKLFMRGLKGAIDQHFVDAYRALDKPPAGDALQYLVSLALCDLALVSTTTDARVAAEAFEGNLIFVITPMPPTYTDGLEFSCLPCGAEVGWLSQYPQEAEWMFPCGTTLYPVPRSERLPSLPFPPKPGKLVLQLYALAPRLLRHPTAGHIFYLDEEEEKAALDFAAARVCLRHSFASTTYGGLESILIDTVFGQMEMDPDDLAAIFSPLALQQSPESSLVMCPQTLLPLLERFFECYCEVRATEGQEVPENFRSCVDFFLEEWRTLPQDTRLDYEAFSEAWVSMKRRVTAKLPPPPSE